jgi:hypothetical protein
MEMLLSIPMVDRLTSMAKYQPTNCAPKHLDTLLKNIYVDMEPEGPDVENVDPILYEIDTSSIIELNGERKPYSMSIAHFNLLLYTAAADVDDDTTLLHKLNSKYRLFQRRHPRTFKNDFCGYIMFMFNDHLEEVIAGSEGDAIFMDDIKTLTDVVTSVIEDGFFRT